MEMLVGDDNALIRGSSSEIREWAFVRDKRPFLLSGIRNIFLYPPKGDSEMFAFFGQAGPPPPEVLLCPPGGRPEPDLGDRIRFLPFRPGRSTFSCRIPPRWLFSVSFPAVWLSPPPRGRRNTKHESLPLRLGSGGGFGRSFFPVTFFPCSFSAPLSPPPPPPPPVRSEQGSHIGFSDLTFSPRFSTSVTDLFGAPPPDDGLFFFPA